MCVCFFVVVVSLFVLQFGVASVFQHGHAFSKVSLAVFDEIKSETIEGCLNGLRLVRPNFLCENNIRKPRKQQTLRSSRRETRCPIFNCPQQSRRDIFCGKADLLLMFSPFYNKVMQDRWKFGHQWNTTNRLTFSSPV